MVLLLEECAATTFIMCSVEFLRVLSVLAGTLAGKMVHTDRAVGKYVACEC